MYEDYKGFRWQLSTFNQAYGFMVDVRSSKISTDPRLYATKTSYPSAMIPQYVDQSNVGVPEWASENWDGTTSLDALNIPVDEPLNYSLLVSEGGSGNFVNVAQALMEMKAQGKTLQQVCNLAKSTN